MATTTEDVDLPILGRVLRARRVPGRLRMWLDEHWRRPEHSPRPHPFTISLECVDAGGAPAVPEDGEDARTSPPPGDAAGAGTPSAPAGEPTRATMPGFELAWRNRGSTWEWREGGSGVRLELDPATARIRTWRAADPIPELLVALHLALCEAIRASGLLPLHAAAAVAPGAADEATTFLGRSGVGKSTTLLRLARAGWTPLAEDLCWVDPVTLTLYGWDRGVHLRPGTLEAFLPDLADEGWRTGSDGKLFRSYDELGMAAVRRATLARVALLARTTSDEPGWAPLAPSDAVRALWEAVGVPLAPAARAAAAAWIGALVERVPIHRLRLGTAALPAGPPDAAE